MTFKKLALASAVAMVPAMGFAVDTLDDTDLADQTGQAGLTVTVGTSGLTGDLAIHDKDGLTGVTGGGSNYSFDGAIFVDNFAMTGGSIVLTIDAGDVVANGAGTGSSPVLNIGVSLPTTTVTTGTIMVGNSGVDGPTTGWTVSNTNTILSSMAITMGSTSLNIQLGAEPQGSMVRMSTTITSGINISGFKLEDGSSGEGINAATVSIKDSVGSNLTVSGLTADVESNGLVINTGTVGGGSIDVILTDVSFGSGAAIGDVSITGLNVNNTTLRVEGH